MSSNISSDSSDSEHSARFKEAVIEAPTSSFVRSSTSIQSTHPDTKDKKPFYISRRPSLRPQTRSEADEKELSVTPEFRKHVAAKFSRKLESELEVIDVNQETSHIKVLPDPEAEDLSFRLFSTSRQELKSQDEGITAVQPKRPLCPSSSSDSEEDSDLASIVVSGDVILQHSQIRPELRNGTLEGATSTAPLGTRSSVETDTCVISAERNTDNVPLRNGQDNIKRKKKKKQKKVLDKQSASMELGSSAGDPETSRQIPNKETNIKDQQHETHPKKKKKKHKH